MPGSVVHPVAEGEVIAYLGQFGDLVQNDRRKGAVLKIDGSKKDEVLLGEGFMPLHRDGALMGTSVALVGIYCVEYKNVSGGGRTFVSDIEGGSKEIPAAALSATADGPSLRSACRAGPGRSSGLRRLLEVDDGPAVVPGPVRQDLDGLDEGPAEVGEAVLDPPRRFGMAFDQTVLLEPTQRLGKDLARDAADEAGELTVPTRPLAEPEEHQHGPFVGDDLDRQARGAVGEEGWPGRVLHEIEGTRR